MEKEQKNYKIGLDIGTNSVGWACVDDDNNICKKSGKYMWGSRLFDEAQSRKNRRLFRGSRRRLARRKQRLNELNILLGPEMNRVDPEFFNKMEESYLVKGEDKQDRVWSVQFFKNKKECKKLMYGAVDGGTPIRKTIYHLRCECMQPKKVDFRLVYLCIHHIMKKRGNFLYEDSQVRGVIGSGEGADSTSAKMIADEVETLSGLLENDFCFNLEASKNEVAEILLNKGESKKDILQSLKDSLVKARGFGDKSKEGKALGKIAELLVGYKADLQYIFPDIEFDGKGGNISLDSLSEKEDELRQKLGERFDVIESINKIYSVFMFNHILRGKSSISEAKVEDFNTHKEHLKMLKELYGSGEKQNFTKAEYDGMFKKPNSQPSTETEDDDNTEKKKKANDIVANYYNYINTPKSVSQEDFGKFVNKKIEKRTFGDEKTEALKAEILRLIEAHEFMPKQTITANGAIPMQFHRAELEKIIDIQGEYYPILKESKDKLLKLFSFRIPYWYGPLNGDSKEFSWIVKRGITQNSQGRDNIKINYLNYDDDRVVDRDKTQEAFITRMLNHCEYLPDERCMPKSSVTCEFYECLSELNGLRANGKYLAFDTKREFIREVLKQGAKIKYTPKDLKNYLSSIEGFAGGDIQLDGLSISDKFNSGFKTTAFFINLGIKLETIEANLDRFDELSSDMTIFNEGDCRKSRLNKFKDLLTVDGKDRSGTVLNHKFEGWSSLSRKLVLGLKDSKGRSILDYLWDDEYNPRSDKRPRKLMNLVASDSYEFKALVEAYQEQYKSQNSFGIREVIEESYCSPPVKRATLQTIKIVEEIEKIMGYEPTRICLEFSSDNERDQRDSRKVKLEKLFKKIKDELKDSQSEAYKYYATRKLDGNVEVSKLEGELKVKSSQLSDERVYLYFTQMGKCLYSGESLNLDSLTTDTEIDHILPQSLIIDNGFDNKALVLKSENQAKSDKCFVKYNKSKSAEIRENLEGWWQYLSRIGLLSPKKFKNLHSDWENDADVYAGFVNRQLVETRQTIKLAKEILREKYPDRDIQTDENLVFRRVVAVNASLNSAYRAKNGLYKLRRVNDCHHAHDAYLSAVLGDYIHNKFQYLNQKTYNSVFTKKLKEACYNLNIKKCNYGAIINVLEEDVINKKTGEVCWKKEWNDTIRQNIYSEKVKCFISKMSRDKDSGEFWGATINPKAKDANAKLVPINKNRADITKYGGYTNRNMAYSLIIKTKQQTKRGEEDKYVLQPIYLINLATAKSMGITTEEYVCKYILDAKFPNGYEVCCKINEWQLLEIDGHPVYKKGDYYKNAKTLVLGENQCKLLYIIRDNQVDYKMLLEEGEELTTPRQVELDAWLSEQLNGLYKDIVAKFTAHYSYMLRAKNTMANLEQYYPKFCAIESLLIKINVVNALFAFVNGVECNMVKLAKDANYGSLFDDYPELEKVNLSTSYGRVQIPSLNLKNCKSFAVVNKSVTGFYQQRKVII